MIKYVNHYSFMNIGINSMPSFEPRKVYICEDYMFICSGHKKSSVDCNLIINFNIVLILYIYY